MCLANGKQLEYQAESVSVMRDSLLKFPQISLWNASSIISSGNTILYL